MPAEGQDRLGPRAWGREGRTCDLEPSLPGPVSLVNEEKNAFGGIKESSKGDPAHRGVSPACCGFWSVVFF